jgi:hypothetical protein
MRSVSRGVGWLLAFLIVQISIGNPELKTNQYESQ